MASTAKGRRHYVEAISTSAPSQQRAATEQRSIGDSGIKLTVCRQAGRERQVPCMKREALKQTPAATEQRGIGDGGSKLTVMASRVKGGSVSRGRREPPNAGQQGQAWVNGSLADHNPHTRQRGQAWVVAARPMVSVHSARATQRVSSEASMSLITARGSQCAHSCAHRARRRNMGGRQWIGCPATVALRHGTVAGKSWGAYIYPSPGCPPARLACCAGFHAVPSDAESN